jgi:hypothetical protein
MYCDATGKAKNFEINSRATSIANLCGYNMQVYGDAYFGKYHDDESMEWERLDFSSADLSSEADWLKLAQRMNQGKKLGGATTSGLLQNMLKSNNTTVIDEEKLSEDTTNSSNADPYLTWNQTSDEMEVRIKLPISHNIKSSELDIKIKGKFLQVIPKRANSMEPWAGANESLHKVMTTGADLWGNIDVDSSAWTLEKHSDHTNIVITLAKSRNVNWPNLTA